MITGDEKSDSDEAMYGHQMTSTCGIDLNEKYNPTIGSKIMIISMYETRHVIKAESLQLNRTQFPSLGICVNKNVGIRKN